MKLLKYVGTIASLLVLFQVPSHGENEFVYDEKVLESKKVSVILDEFIASLKNEQPPEPVRESQPRSNKQNLALSKK